ncbi:hypothetical protein BS47DRAFT_1340739 [Hydnum rufescens UP504]|uniref:Uncharacterized protein n=1 Tax=Hydnum rufescens UP504 TaxID=1448309 RepID=A0A9P6DZ28_9AGAM|nr:hypothetical protein BS47DRAFT_1340739 [Hydnum rufescens UP504]
MGARQLARRFVPLNPTASLSVANPSRIADTNGPPKVILVFAWLDAEMRTISKYTEGYHALFPEADQMIIHSHRWSLWWSNSTREAALRPVVEHLRARGIYNLHGPSSRVLVHVMSNGGCFQLIALSRLLAEVSFDLSNQSPESTKSSLDSKSGAAFVFDSCPGLANFYIMVKALTAGIKTRWLRTLLTFPDGVMAHMPSRILFPGSIFSPKQGSDIESHIEQAKEKGVQSIVVLKDETSGHVDHLRRDPAKYWETIRRLWFRG